MKQFKKLAAPLLAAALLMGTAACGGGGATSSSGTSSPDSSSPSADAVTFTVTADVTGDRAPYVERFAQLVEEKTEGRYHLRCMWKNPETVPYLSHKFLLTSPS